MHRVLVRLRCQLKRGVRPVRLKEFVEEATVVRDEGLGAKLPDCALDGAKPGVSS
jgi:hypothetical protein